ncbi:hypothetical protein CR513_03406, partial [Mucuna pruriens]
MFPCIEADLFVSSQSHDVKILSPILFTFTTLSFHFLSTIIPIPFFPLTFLVYQYIIGSISLSFSPTHLAHNFNPPYHGVHQLHRLTPMFQVANPIKHFYTSFFTHMSRKMLNMRTLAYITLHAGADATTLGHLTLYLSYTTHFFRINLYSSVAFLPDSTNPTVTTSITSRKAKSANILTFQLSNNFPSKTDYKLLINFMALGFFVARKPSLKI